MEVVAVGALAATAASTIYSKRNSDIQKKQVKKANEAAQKSYDLEKRQAELALDEQRRKNLNILNQQLSSYKARLGAAGMSSKQGSGSALLYNAEKEHDIEDKYLQEQANISLEALLNGIESTKTRNLLTLSSLNNEKKASQWGTLANLTSGARSLLK